MADIPSLLVTPSGVTARNAAGAYGLTDSFSSPTAATPDGASFSGMVSRAMQGVVAAGHEADRQTVQAVSGGGDLTSVVTAVSQAELALQTTVAIRDRVVAAYQDIMKMPI
jgi:flagellar hook-basal body complex protein FliE